MDSFYSSDPPWPQCWSFAQILCGLLWFGAHTWGIDSHHNMTAKYSVINTLIHRDKAVWSTPVVLKTEEHLNKATLRYKYPLWALTQWSWRITLRKTRYQTKESNRTIKEDLWFTSHPLHPGITLEHQKHMQKAWHKCTFQKWQDNKRTF